MSSDFRAKNRDRCILNDKINGQHYLSINQTGLLWSLVHEIELDDCEIEENGWFMKFFPEK